MTLETRLSRAGTGDHLDERVGFQLFVRQRCERIVIARVSKAAAAVCGRRSPPRTARSLRRWHQRTGPRPQSKCPSIVVRPRRSKPCPDPVRPACGTRQRSGRPATVSRHTARSERLAAPRRIAGRHLVVPSTARATGRLSRFVCSGCSCRAPPIRPLADRRLDLGESPFDLDGIRECDD